MGLLGRASSGGLVASPLLLGTTLLALCGWVTALAGQCALESKRSSHVPYVWFGIFVQLGAIVCFTCSAQAYTLASYRLLTTALLAMAIVLAALAADETVYAPSSADDASSAYATAAGYILLLAAEIPWLVMVGSDANTVFGQLLGPAGARLGLDRPTRASGGSADPYAPVAHEASPRSVPAPMAADPRGRTYDSEAGYSSAGGPFAPASPSVVHVIPKPLETIALARVGSAQEKPTPAEGPSNGPAMAASSSQYASSPTPAAPAAREREPVRARALYAYSASPDDPNELSFTKGEVLDVLDCTGKWWQARNAHGYQGIVPSNYMQRLE